MIWNEHLTEIRNTLTDLYPDRDEALVLVQDAGIDHTRIRLGGSAKVMWSNIIKKSHDADKLPDLIRVAKEEYPDRLVEVESLMDNLNSGNGINTSNITTDMLQPVRASFTDTIIKKIEQDDLEGVLKDLNNIVTGFKLTEDLDGRIELNARLARLKKDMRMGIVTYDQQRIERAKIRVAIKESILSDSWQDFMSIHTGDLNTFAASTTILNTPTVSEMEKIIGPNDLVPITWFMKALKASSAVCMVELASGGTGTGFLLKNGYVLTNHHVLNSQQATENARIILNYSEDIQGQRLKELKLPLSNEIFFSSPNPWTNGEINPDIPNGNFLDYALVKVDDRNNQLDQFGYLELEDFKSIGIGQKVNIIGHPAGEPMKLGLPDSIVGHWDHYLYYLTDTLEGSSGSAVFNQDWRVVALHHAGRNDGEGLQIDEQGNMMKSNRGIAIKAILKDLELKGFDTSIFK